MAIRDINIEYNEAFDDVPSFFSQKHGQLTVRGLGKFAEGDTDEEIGNYLPFLPELELGGGYLQLKVTVTQKPEGLHTTNLGGGITKYYPLGGVSFVKANAFISAPVWVYFDKQIVVAPGPGFVDYLPLPGPGVQFSIQPWTPADEESPAM